MFFKKLYRFFLISIQVLERQLLFFYILATAFFYFPLCQADPGTGFHLAVQAPVTREKLGGAYVVVDAGTYEDVREIADKLQSLQSPNGKGISPSPNEPVEVVIVVPKGVPDQYAEVFRREVERKLRERYPQATFTTQFSYIDTEVEEDVIERAIETLNGAPKLEFPAVEQERAALLAVLDETQTDLRTWRDSWYGKGIEWLSKINPLKRNLAAFVVGGLKGALTCKVTITKYGLNSSSWIIGLLNGMVTAAFGWYATEFSRWRINHKVPLTEKYPRLNALIEYYNNNKFVKSMSVNFVRAYLIDFFSLLSAHLTGQKNKKGELIESPVSLKFFSSSSGLTVVEMLSDAAMDIALETLTQKGYLNYSSRSYILWALSFLGTWWHAHYRTGDIASAIVILSISTAINATFYSYSKSLSPNPKRIVVISDLISRNSVDMGHVRNMLNLQSAWNINPTEESLTELQNVRITPQAVSKLLNLGDAPHEIVKEITAAIISGMSPTNACMKALEREKI